MSVQEHVPVTTGGVFEVKRLPGNPLWKDVSAELLREVRSGTFDVRFPGELELAQRYGVSRGTIRAALKPLREAGQVSAHPGRKPKVVAGKSTAYGPLYSVLASIRESGMTHSSIVLQQHTVQNSTVAAVLSLDATAELFHLARIRLADGEPIGLDEVWLPADSVSALKDSDFSQHPLYGELDRRCGIVLDGGTESLSAVLADKEQAGLLACSAGAPLLLIERIGCYRAQSLEFRRSYVVGDRVEISTAFGCKA